MSVCSNLSKSILSVAPHLVTEIAPPSWPWQLVASTEYTVNTTSTSPITVGTFATGDTSIWTSDSYILVRIRDKAGKRSGYFYGSDVFIINHYPVNEASASSLSAGNVGMAYRCSQSGAFGTRYMYASTCYGVYADTIDNTGSIHIGARYHNSYTLTINGT